VDLLRAARQRGQQLGVGDRVVEEDQRREQQVRRVVPDDLRGGRLRVA
jgi:hypothetical protein